MRAKKQDFKPLIGIIEIFLTSLSILIKCKLAKGSFKNHVDKMKWVDGWSIVHFTEGLIFSRFFSKPGFRFQPGFWDELPGFS